MELNKIPEFKTNTRTIHDLNQYKRFRTQSLQKSITAQKKNKIN